MRIDDPFDVVASGVLVHVEYDGAPFCGWSRQPDLPTVEGAIRDACTRLGLTPHVVRCAGRTDTGVHAAAQVVELVYDGVVPPDKLHGAIVTTLPPAIAVVSVEPLPGGMDVRGDAIARAYDYRVLTRRAPSPLRAGRVVHHPRALDRPTLDELAAATEGHHDFRAFTPTRTEHTHFRRTVHVCSWRDEPGDELVLRIQADAFLRNMVRVLVGTMLEVARGLRPARDYHDLLAGNAVRSGAGATAAPHGLCLVRVDYPDRSFGEAQGPRGLTEPSIG